MKRIALSIAALAAATLSGPLAAGDRGHGGAEMVTVHDVDFRGRPPFRRTIETLPAAEVARLERAPQIEDGDRMVTVNTVDFRGKPPFARSTETLPLREVARFEVLPEGGDHRGRRFGRPGFKGHAR